MSTLPSQVVKFKQIQVNAFNLTQHIDFSKDIIKTTHYNDNQFSIFESVNKKRFVRVGLYLPDLKAFVSE